ncbi:MULTISPECIES: manganese-dependent inorganic pyrophosphatase [unclassified Granulicatella]|uniref:manganese-dependent inorganic pyrophosphatase n=1 Tax=unclassified Granulicatella TaxID=2630493 RepID=UPI001073F465|nr:MULTISPECIES: manganese-dependent inorganic pyrophosphatase [unclassified Granulicatella]MBF0780439.1 manganese-dependent inorganic pyrophosphatase [Granulicatella sp. 19428wC4_WM01]TFU95428.1 manganese-dependent inorganic pyrophosphatase [Granulicatella sp. WM01]
MSTLLVFGHQNPDTDTISSAIAYAYLLNRTGKQAEAVALGEPNEETKFALNYFQVDAPRIVSTVSNEVKQVALVDHNELQQSVSDLKEVEVTAVIDHHRIANFETANPLLYRAEPVGCTATILYKLFSEERVTIPKEIAGLMLSAIISDTLLFKSPTCTPLDVQVAKELAVIADVELEVYGLSLLKAGTNLGDKSVQELLNLDAKTFPMGQTSVRIAQVNTVDEAELLVRQQELEDAMLKENADNGYDLFVLVITNILTSASVVVVAGEPKEAIEQAFNVTLTNHTATLEGVVSRKKQVVPQLTAVLAK